MNAAHHSVVTELSGLRRWKTLSTLPPALPAADLCHQRLLYQLGRELDATPLSFLFTLHGLTDMHSMEMNRLLKAPSSSLVAHLRKNLNLLGGAVSVCLILVLRSIV